MYTLQYKKPSCIRNYTSTLQFIPPKQDPKELVYLTNTFVFRIFIGYRRVNNLPPWTIHNPIYCCYLLSRNF